MQRTETVHEKHCEVFVPFGIFYHFVRYPWNLECTPQVQYENWSLQNQMN